jgi:hypothetical protein
MRRLGACLLSWGALLGLAAAWPHAALAAGRTASPPSVRIAAANAARELMGTGDGSPVAWDSATGQWGGQSSAHWWQSARALISLVRYAERTDDLDPAVQNVLRRTYQLNEWRFTVTQRPNFTNQFLDDTAWWGQAWLAASQYELSYRHDRASASRFLTVAEADASYILKQPRPCGGLAWQIGWAPGTITNAEFVALAAGLASYRQKRGIFYEPQRAAAWLSAARGALKWLERSRLIDLNRGEVVKDRMRTVACHSMVGGPVSYTQAEVAEGMVQLGKALRDSSYYEQAARFLRYVVNPAHGFVSAGVLQDHCEPVSPNCAGNPQRLDVTAFKGIVTQALADWSAATGSQEFEGFLHAQATAVLTNDVWGATAQSPGCRSPHTCQFGLSWARPVSPMLVTDGTQGSALSALTAALG